MLILLLAAAAVIAVPALTPALLTLVHRRRPAPGAPAPGPSAPQRILFFIPAHDEEGMIAECVGSVRRMDYPADRLRVVVIADNCSDRTAERARAAGAEVLERHDLTQRGKPYAIAWALQQQDLATLDAVVILDADSVVEAGFARALDASGPLRRESRQAYFATLNEEDNWLTRLAAVFARARYEVTYTARERAGLNCTLTGNGMVFGSELLAERGWTAFGLTEDWELYATLTADGVPIRYVQGARLLSQEIQDLSQGVSQRRRWMLGRRETLKKWFRPLLASPKIDFAQKLDTILELVLPPPVGFMTVAFVLALLGVLVVGGTWGWIIAAVALSSQLPLGLAVARVLVDHPAPLKVLASAAFLPGYAVWRVAVSIRTMLGGSGSGWVRTQRNARAS